MLDVRTIGEVSSVNMYQKDFNEDLKNEFNIIKPERETFNNILEGNEENN